MPEPVSTVIALGTGLYKLIQSSKAKQKAQELSMRVTVIKKSIDSAAAKGKYDDIQKAMDLGQIPNELIEYANAVIASKPMIEVQQASVDAGVSSRKAYESLYATKIPSVSSGETKEVIKQQTISSIAKQITESPLQLIQKYWYVIPIILIPLILFIRKRK